jgi:hypothetical protein
MNKLISSFSGKSGHMFFAFVNGNIIFLWLPKKAAHQEKDDCEIATFSLHKRVLKS